MGKKLIRSLFLLVFLTLTLNVVLGIGPTPGAGGPVPTFPSDLKDVPQWLWDIVIWVLAEWFGFDATTQNWFMFIWVGILPFFSVWIIVYAFLKELRIFRRTRKVNGILSFLIAFSTLPTHMFLWLVNVTFNLMSFWAVLVFAFIFAVGIWKYGVVRRSQWTSAAATAEAEAVAKKSIKEQLSQLYEERKLLVEEIPDARGKRLDQITQRLDKIDAEISNVRAQMKQLDDI
ncbi:hypothetical protein A3K63_00780 [Candidatus Micrarchaeota archaeon RBG_16_49_10]|nr:MAG: hypothetical protein A3K63_00780 [Candidatus Micrarchaeota archaeon RBG_16_49_10]